VVPGVTQSNSPPIKRANFRGKADSGIFSIEKQGLIKQTTTREGQQTNRTGRLSNLNPKTTIDT
jgi:hypothetical protein